MVTRAEFEGENLQELNMSIFGNIVSAIFGHSAVDTTAAASSATVSPAADSKIVARGASLQKLAEDFVFTEGPACDAKGNVFFTDQPNDRILRWGETPFVVGAQQG